MKRVLITTVSVLSLAAFASPAAALDESQRVEHDHSGNKLTERFEDEFYDGLGNKLTERFEDEFYDGLGNKLNERYINGVYEYNPGRGNH